MANSCKILLFGFYCHNYLPTQFILNELNRHTDLVPSLSAPILLNKFHKSLKVFPFIRLAVDLVDELILTIFALLQIWKDPSIGALYIGFGGDKYIKWARSIRYLTRKKIILHALTSKSFVGCFYKIRGPQNPTIVKKLKEKEVGYLNTADIIIYESKLAADFVFNWLGVDYSNKLCPIRLSPDPTDFYLSPLPKIQNKIKVVWWGSLSKIHGFDVILKSMEMLKEDEKIEFTIISTLSFGEVLGTTQDEALSRIARCNAKIIPWEIEFDQKTSRLIQSLSTQTINSIIRDHHVCLGVFNANDHVRTIWANKEIEAMYLGRPVITINRVDKQSPVAQYCKFAEDEHALAKILKQISRTGIPEIDIQQRALWLEAASQEVHELFKRIQR